MKTHPTAWAAMLVLSVTVLPCEARTSNGNDFALYFTEAGTADEREQLFREARGRPHFFRYLQIMEMEEDTSDGRSTVRITAFEPASYMDVVFTVTKPVSLAKLKEAPASKVGDAVAVTGTIQAVEEDRNAILLDEVIVRYKDRLSPKMGKELLGEVDPGAVFYSFTRGPRPVQLSYRDRDLLKHRDRILDEQGERAWAEFLERELSRREQARAGTAQQSGNQSGNHGSAFGQTLRRDEWTQMNTDTPNPSENSGQAGGKGGD